MITVEVRCPNCTADLSQREEESASPFFCPHCKQTFSPTQLPPEERMWYFARKKNRIGPLSWAELSALMQAGRIQQTDSILLHGTSQWLAPNEIPELVSVRQTDGEADTVETAGPSSQSPQTEREVVVTSSPAAEKTDESGLETNIVVDRPPLPQEDHFNIRDVEASFGLLGPVRQRLEYLPLEEVFFRYRVTGLSTNDEDQIDMEIDSWVTDSSGRKLAERSHPVKGRLYFGGGCYTGSSFAELRSNLSPGVYVFNVTVRDRLASVETSFQKAFKVVPLRFAIVSPRFVYRDGSDAPAGGLVGQMLGLRFRVVGFDKSTGRIQTECSLSVTDSHGTLLLRKPVCRKLASDDPAKVRDATFLHFAEFFGLNRVGDFLLCLDAKDLISGQTDRLELPIRVGSSIGVD
ncbi:MAG: hypothetical protein KatS3mg105_2997 [Gemmatales bacterium]|nr:MAG: hypothetical protein KatS3mg105_2997 [Gemmatales bacterium]